MRFRLQFIAVPIIAFAAACGGGGDGGSPNNSPTGPSNPGNPNPTAPTNTNAVNIGDDFFSPGSIQVAPGTTVTWTWPSGVSIHNVTFTDGNSSGDKGPGGSYSRTFNTEGTFNYLCTLHGGMNGSVLVKS